MTIFLSYFLGRPHASVKECKRIRRHKLYKYKNEKPCIVLNNENDENTSNNRLRGGYTYDESNLENIKKIKTFQVFDRALVELLISIPSIYQRNIIKYLQEQKLKLTQLISDEITHDKINYFVFFYKIYPNHVKANPEFLRRITVNIYQFA